VREKVASCLSKSKDACIQPQSQTYNETWGPTFHRMTQLYDYAAKQRNTQNIRKKRYQRKLVTQIEEDYEQYRTLQLAEM